MSKNDEKWGSVHTNLNFYGWLQEDLFFEYYFYLVKISMDYKPTFPNKCMKWNKSFFKIAMEQYDRYEVDSKEMGTYSQWVQIYKTSRRRVTLYQHSKTAYIHFNWLLKLHI